MSKGKTYEQGHFTKHNADVVARIEANTDLAASFNTYVDELVKAGILLIDAGASPEQMKSSLQAVSDQKAKAFAAIIKGTHAA